MPTVEELQAENERLLTRLSKAFDEIERLKKLEELQAENEQLKVSFNEESINRQYAEAENEKLKKLREYSHHHDYCNPKPWENKCDCGYLQALKGE